MLLLQRDQTQRSKRYIFLCWIFRRSSKTCVFAIENFNILVSNRGFSHFNQKLHNSYPCLEQSWHYAGDRLTFSVHTIRRRNLKTQKQSRTSHLDLCLRKTQGRDPWRVRFRSVFRSHQNAKPGLANSLGSKSIFRKNFRKAPFSWRVSVDGRPNCRNKAAFLKFLRRNVNGA